MHMCAHLFSMQVNRDTSCHLPEATAARNQNSIGDRTEKKTLGETRLSRGAISPLARRQQFNSLLQSQIGGLIWFPRSCPDGCLGDGVLTGDLSLGLI